MVGGEREVERVEVVLEDAGTTDGGDPAAAAPIRPGRRWPMWAGAAVVVVLGLTSVVLTAQDERREEDRRQALADVPGLLPRLDGPPEEAWRVPDAWPVALGPEVVVLAPTAGPDALTGVDLRTGAELWTRAVDEDETCTTLSPDSAPARPAVGLPVVEHLACYRTFATVEGHGVVVGEPAEVEVLDVATGAAVAVLPTPADVLGVEPAGTDVLVASLDPGGAVVVARWALPGEPGGRAEQAWTRGLPEPLESIDETGWVFHAETDVVRVGTVGSVPLDLATGDPRPDATREGVLYAVDAPLPGGGRVEWDYDDVAASTGVSRVVSADGATRELDGVPWLPDVDDGSPPAVLVVRRPASVYDAAAGTGELVAVDVATGADLWSAGRMAGVHALARIEGMVVAAGAGKVLALDLRDGDVVWQDVTAGVSTQPGGLTDGDVVLLLQGAGADQALVARDLRTGLERWRTPLADVGRAGGWLALVPTSAGILVLRDDGVALLSAGAPRP